MWLRRIAIVLLALSPAAALSDLAPQVTLATPGSAGAGDGTIERFTLRFSEAMVPLGDPRAAAPASSDCPVASTGRWVDAQTFVFDFESALPGGVTCAISLRDDLASQRGVGLTGTRRFVIDTGGPSARGVLTGSYGEVEEGQIFLVATNVAADPRSVATYGYCSVDGIGERIALDVQPRSVIEQIVTGLGRDNYRLRSFLSEVGLPEQLPAAAADRARSLDHVIAVRCRRPLPPGRDMALLWDARIATPGGKQAGRDQRFDFSVRKAFSARFECNRVNAQAGCDPVQDAYVRFTAPVPRAAALAVRLTLADGRSIAPTPGDGDRNATELSDLTFKPPFAELSEATVTLPADVRDASGRALENGARFPLKVRFDRQPPLVKFAATFGIIEAKEGGVLPVTVRSVEPALARTTTAIAGRTLRLGASDAEVADWLRRLDAADDSDFAEIDDGKGGTVSINRTGATPLLSKQAGAATRLPLPGNGKAFEVVGIPLGQPGFYVVELASPALGKALLGRDATRYVAAGGLVTNMAVHFKWGRAGSLAWVTALDSGRPVVNAEVRVSDSCTGAQLATGRSDAMGRVMVAKGLPEPHTSEGCEEDEHPLMVSARAGGDFSFTLTQWGQGIRPYDFDLPYGWSARDDILHTIFDRTLIRAGETVNMKHILRHPVASGFALVPGFTGTLTLTHRGSDTSYDMPVTIGRDGIGESRWTAPQGAPMGDYDLRFTYADASGEQKSIYTDQSIRLDEFRLPTMRASVAGPKAALVRPTSVPLSLFVGYLSGGGAAGLPVAVRTAFASDMAAPDGYDGYSFGGTAPVAGTRRLDDNGEAPAALLPFSQTLPVTLDGAGNGRAAIEVGQPIANQTAMTVEMDYQDANGETLTASQRILLHPAGVRIGVKTDGWLMRDDDLRLKLVAVDLEGKPVKGQRVSVGVFSREIITARRRLIGGFYAYDNQEKVTRIDADCTATTDERGEASCAIDPDTSGEVTVVAEAKDSDGNVARAVTSAWLAGDEDWWFGGDNGDRMDLVPEAKAYKAGETAKFQVRMPFRSATALVTVEREGVLSSFVTTLSGKDPVVEVAMPGSYAPDVYVSVMAVRGRIGGFRLWLADLARRWNLPFFSREGASPTALVDLAKPSYRIGIAKVKVGWEAHALGVTVKADRAKYAVRDTAQVDVAVRMPDGKPAASAEIAFVAVDEALLQLAPNDSVDVLTAMMGERTLDVLTSTGQTQVVGKRHYGRKAVEAGGGGGDASGAARSDFRPVLLWKGRVRLDATGHARIPVALSDNLSAFRMVAIATAGADLFGTGETSVRTAQDLSIFAGLPPLVRTGDSFAATFSLRNGSEHAMTVTATPALEPAIARGRPLTVTIPGGGTVPVAWTLTAPPEPGALRWTVAARSADGRAVDRVVAVQDVAPAVPVEVWAASFLRVGPDSVLPVAPPAGALPGGFVDVRLSASIAPPLAGVRAYMAAYPWNCFEQQTSRAIALGDTAGWNAIAAGIPGYIDGQGLLRYFPSDRLPGSPELTAYVLSATAAAGLAIPDANRARMLEAMRGLIEGRIVREGEGPADVRLLKVGALSALARNDAATPALFGAIDLAPADMPTGTLADYMVAIDRTPGLPNAAALRTQAEALLRRRLVYEGTRLDLADDGRAPWWMMVGGDEMAIKALDAVLGRAGWEDEAAKMMIGVAGRQSRGHWDTTPANAWGAIVTRRFAAAYPESAVAGTTTATLGATSRAQGWPMAADAPALRLPLARAPLRLQHAGPGPWATVSVSAAVPLRAPLFAGYRMSRAVGFLSRKAPDRVSIGDVVKVTLTVDAGADRNWVVISDPVPPGGTIVGNLGGQSGMFGAAAGEDDAPSYVERGRDAWRGYFAWLPAGRTTVSYAVRLNAPGSFGLPPSRVEAMYAPAIRAQLPNARLTVAPR